MRHTIFPIALIACGAALLAEELGWLSTTQWIGPIALIAIGCGVLATEGINRSSIVGGPLLIYMGIAWIVHEQGLAPWRVLQAIGLIVLGVTLFAGRLPGVPDRRPRAPKTPPGAPPP